LSMRFLF